MNKLNAKNRINFIIDFIEYGIALLLLFSANSIYIHDYINLHLKIVLSLLLIVYLIAIVTKNNINNIQKYLKKYFKYFLLYYIYAIIFMILNGSYTRSFISVFLIILPIFTFIYLINNKKDNILINFLKLVLIFSGISLILYLVLDVFKIIPYQTIIKIKWGTIRYIPTFFGLHFNTQTIHMFGIEIPRNTGIFTEAPMYSLVLTIALSYFEFLYNGKKDNRIRALLIITIITTFSTTGYISTILIYMFLLINYYFKNSKKIKKIPKYVIPLLLIILLFPCIWLLSYKLSTNSGSIRIDDYKASYKTWIEHGIILGAGFNNEDAIIENMSKFRKDNQGLSNSTMVVLAEGGIMLFMIYLIPFLLSINYAIKNKNNNILYFDIIILFLFCTTIFAYTALMINILSKGYYITLKEK